ncbi:DUF2071 domain-containing protein [Curtobacterium sp. MCBD17_003]|uniref:DUF2071 domain-containing protein n=1 Tax=Curtobacterium sp. MCBD17_003 TaxID=2175667 RepID=UPI000DA98022|nr:DUF2071 domain-containing protein [Curtobacterium sp. MCBD17_003]WIE53770.1 DUF2071 domain-containing protein [Curtobacterium sp. MCBD17_003]
MTNGPQELDALADVLVAQTAAPLPHRAVTAHRWADVVFASWRMDADTVASLVPPRTEPDRIDGSAWVSLTAYEFRRTTVPPLPPPGPFGRLTEITVEVPTVDDAGRHGTTYLTVDTQHVPAVLAARIGIGVPYTAARAGSRRDGDVLAHRTRRRHGGASASVRVRAAGGVTPDALSVALTHRPGVHARHLGVTSWWRRSHAPWQLRAARAEELRGDLPDVVGFPRLLDRVPDRLLVGDGVDVEYAWGGLVR